MKSTSITKKAALAFIREKLSTNDQWAVRGLKVVYARQTESEKMTEATKEDNGVGFSGLDAQFLTSLAKQHEARGSLSPKQMVWLRKKISKYAAQVLSVTNMEKLAALMNPPTPAS
jgi:hypothetical protein